MQKISQKCFITSTCQKRRPQALTELNAFWEDNESKGDIYSMNLMDDSLVVIQVSHLSPNKHWKTSQLLPSITVNQPLSNTLATAPLVLFGRCILIMFMSSACVNTWWFGLSEHLFQAGGIGYLTMNQNGLLEDSGIRCIGFHSVEEITRFLPRSFLIDYTTFSFSTPSFLNPLKCEAGCSTLNYSISLHSAPTGAKNNRNLLQILKTTKRDNGLVYCADQT